jgi:GT2 family glycosyltransferase
VLPRDHVAVHLAARKPGIVMAGDCCRLDEAASAQVTSEVIRADRHMDRVPASERKRLARRHRKAWYYNLICHPSKPRLVGNNVAVWRRDFERVNGYDEAFEGWGCEDDDFGIRLRRVGVRVRSILGRTFTVHLWHPPDTTAPQLWREGLNVQYLKQNDRPARCRNGLNKAEPGHAKTHAA